ncbi:MAG: ASKHA domain-containing protein [Armatimonadota bacterium]
MVRVVFKPGGTEIVVPAGTLLSRAAAAAGMAIESPCGGMGVCGKCKVLIDSNPPEPDPVECRLLSSQEIDKGFRLACRTRVRDDISVLIPLESRSRVQKILSHGVLRECDVNSGVLKIYCQLDPPSLNDERAEFERVAEYLNAVHGVVVRPNLNIVRSISRRLRDSNYTVTATIYQDQLIALEAGDTSSSCYGIAYDLGSTTVVGYLMDLITGRELAVSSTMNPQTLYGDDLVSRISFASTQEGGSEILRSVVVDALSRIAENLARAAKVSLDHVYKVTVVGNTCMTHLLLGIDVTSLGQSPYVPGMCSDVTVTAKDLGLPIVPEAPVIVLPNVAGFVGSDLVGVLLASEWEKDGRTRLAVDIGTNGEMALLHDGKTYVCSAAAGPAFEGAGISCGMRGAPGAIDSVVISDDIYVSTIDNRRPIGICGSGLVDAVAQMLDAGLIDGFGRLLSPDEFKSEASAVRRRLINGSSGPEFMLVEKHSSGTGMPITLTHTDIRRLQLAKGSIRAAIATLMRIAGVTEEDLSEVLLAGAFGNYIRVESAIRIGLLPAVPLERVLSIGNAAGAGARLALLCEHEMQVARELARKAIHVELAVSPDYQMELMERMMFPTGSVII